MDESAALGYQVEDADVLTLRRLEAEALRRAVLAAFETGSDSGARKTSAGWAATALTVAGAPADPR